MQRSSDLTVYQHFCDELSITPINQSIEVMDYSSVDLLAQKLPGERLTAAIHVFIESILDHEQTIERVDRTLLDYLIVKLDTLLNDQLDEILHHPLFQRLESAWRSLSYLIEQVDFRANTKVELLNVSKEALLSNFTDLLDTTQTALYKQVYEAEYDTPGGEPITAMVANYEFDSRPNDLNLLRNLAKVASATHCPFIASANSQFFGKESFAEVAEIHDLENYMQRAEFIPWNKFRESEDARYIGLTCPRFLLRLPYGQDNPIKTFRYEETVYQGRESYLWGNASFAFAANMARSFKQHGWTVNIRGPEAGGKVINLPLHQYDLGHGRLTKIPTEILIPETRELSLANLGLIPLSYYKNSDYACFFSANSVQRPQIYLDAAATANSRINSRLPYIFLSARIAHYLKVLQRETIGSNVGRAELEERLNQWLQTLITKMNNPDPGQIAKHPLREGRVEVSEIEENPGFYRVILYAMPHFQIEGVDVSLSIVGKMPRLKNQ